MQICKIRKDLNEKLGKAHFFHLSVNKINSFMEKMKAIN